MTAGTGITTRFPYAGNNEPTNGNPTREMLEKEIQDALLTFLRYHPRVAWVERMNIGATKIGNRFIRFGKPGMCDLTGQLKDGRRLEVEVKRPGQKARPEQQAFIDMVVHAGGVAFVASSIDDAKEQLALV